MAHMTAEEARSARIQDLGAELGALFDTLTTELTWLHVRWAQYRELYGTRTERIDMLNQAAPYFFRIVEDALWQDTILNLCRLTDDRGRGKGARMSIHQLPRHVQNLGVRRELEGLVELAVLATSFARDWRNRKYAHLNLQLALQTGAEPLAHASRAFVETALSALDAVMNCVSERLRDITQSFTLTPSSGALDLLYVLRDGLAVKAERAQRLSEGKPIPSDWAPGTI